MKSGTTTDIEQIQKQFEVYKQTVNAKVDTLEAGLERLLIENERLIKLRKSAEIERDACIALAAQLAISAGLSAGAVKGNLAVIDLPSGQVSWEIGENETHLIAGLPSYEKPIEAIEISEKYNRVMNSKITEDHS